MQGNDYHKGLKNSNFQEGKLCLERSLVAFEGLAKPHWLAWITSYRVVSLIITHSTQLSYMFKIHFTKMFKMNWYTIVAFLGILSDKLGHIIFDYRNHWHGIIKHQLVSHTSPLSREKLWNLYRKPFVILEPSMQIFMINWWARKRTLLAEISFWSWFTCWEIWFNWCISPLDEQAVCGVTELRGYRTSWRCKNSSSPAVV